MFKGSPPEGIALQTLVQELRRALEPILSIPKRYLNEWEASRYVGLSVHALRPWRGKEGMKGPAYLKIGSRIVYDKRDLDSWMEQFRTEK